MLRILVQNRPDSLALPGGDTVQMQATVRALRSAGHAVTISYALSPPLDDIDVVHLFNLTRAADTAAQAENARRHNKPYVLSPVYWDIESAVPSAAHPWPFRWLTAAARAARQMGLRRRAATNRRVQARVLAGARLVFPNSRAEAAHLTERLGPVEPDRLRVVLNGVSYAVTTPIGRDAEAAGEWSRGRFLCAGAIGPRKNQYHLVRAFERLPDHRLLIVGAAAPGCERYHRSVVRAAGPRVEFREPVRHQQVGALMRNALAVVQPSFIETPGLSALEAAALGVPIVVADVAPVREYFQDIACYCDPRSPASIAAACRAAAATPRTDGRALRERYTWTRVLEPLVDAYAKLDAEWKAGPAASRPARS